MAQVPPSNSDEDVIRFIMKCVVRRDRTALVNADNIHVEKENLFWTAVDGFPFTFVDPPQDFISEWDGFNSVTKNGVRFEGPLWSLEQGPTYDVYLIVDKDFKKTRKQYSVWGIRPN